jgi:hypothetical protein
VGKFIALEQFDFLLNGKHIRFPQGAPIPEAIRAQFGVAKVPVVPKEDAERLWYCPACRNLAEIATTCTVSTLPVFVTPAAVRVVAPHGGLLKFEAGQHVTRTSEMDALRLGGVAVTTDPNAGLVTLVCPVCGAAVRKVLSTPWVRQEVANARIAEYRQAALEDAARQERAEVERRVSERKAKSYERIRVLKAKKEGAFNG